MDSSRTASAMITRTRSRVGSLMALLLFLGVLTAEAFAVRGCPHHELDAPGSEQVHPGAAAVAVSAPGDSHDHDDHVPCRCVGTCHAGAAAPLLTTAPSPLTSSGSSSDRAPLPPSDIPRTGPASYLLPYPNGPPPS